MRPVILAVGALALVLLALGILLSGDLRSLSGRIERITERNPLDKPITLDITPMHEPPIWKKKVTIEGTEIEISWTCPPRLEGELEKDYAARCLRLFMEYCAGLGLS